LNRCGLDEVIRNIVGVDIILVGKREAMERVNTLKREISPNNIYSSYIIVYVIVSSTGSGKY